MLSDLISPVVTIAALGMIESLLCGASAARMKSEPFHADQELIAQGVGNILLPFFGGVPATAAIARTSVAIKSGQQTRLTSVFHSVFCSPPCSCSAASWRACRSPRSRAS